MEIGSIYELDPELISSPVSSELLENIPGEIRKYNKKFTTFTASGREAIAFALKSLVENEPDVAKKCLLPAYMCDAVFLPFEQAGWEIYFYHLDINLKADSKELSDQIEKLRPGLLLIHSYYGIDTWKPIRSLIQEWRAQGLYIMEDVTQSYYCRDIGKEADYVVGSLRKWYPVPDGGFVLSDHKMPKEKLLTSEVFSQRKQQILIKKWFYLNRDIIQKQQYKEAYLQENKEIEEWLDRYHGISVMSKVTEKIIMQIDEEKYRQQRNENYKYLYEKVKGMHSLCSVPLKVCQGDDMINAAPLYFPIYVQERENLQEFLRMHDIYAPVLWPIGKENRSCLTEGERYIFEHILALPMDQRYGINEMCYIVEMLKKFELDQIESGKAEFI